MSIFLGHPVYSLSVLLSTLILSLGIGSFLSEGLPLRSVGRLVTWSAGTGIYATTLPFVLTPLFVALNDAELAGRIGICVALIAPLGVMMGFGFPTGMRLISFVDPKPTPWFWGINGAAGVLASIMAVALSLALGINATLLGGALCYFLLIPVSLPLLRPERIAGEQNPASPKRVRSRRPKPVRAE
jgi:hypothetical protein